MSEVSSLEVTAGVAVVATALSAFATFCPPMSDVLHGTDERTRRTLDFGQNAGAVATVATGVVLAWVTRSPMPLAVSIALGIGITFAYEFAFRREV